MLEWFKNNLIKKQDIYDGDLEFYRNALGNFAMEFRNCYNGNLIECGEKEDVINH